MNDQRTGKKRLLKVRNATVFTDDAVCCHMSRSLSKKKHKNRIQFYFLPPLALNKIEWLWLSGTKKEKKEKSKPKYLLLWVIKKQIVILFLLYLLISIYVVYFFIQFIYLFILFLI